MVRVEGAIAFLFSALRVLVGKRCVGNNSYAVAKEILRFAVARIV